MDRVGFTPRLGALLIDLGLFAAAIHLFMAVDVFLNLLTPLNNFGFVSLFCGGLLLFGYGASEVLMAATPGKRLAGLVVAAADGQPAPRRALLKRWAAKNLAVFFAAPAVALWTLLSPHNYHVPLPAFVVPGIVALAVIDTVLTGLLLVMLMAGCALCLRPGRQTLHDRLAGTAVFRRAEMLAPRAFAPVMARVAVAGAGDANGGEAAGGGASGAGLTGGNGG